MLKIELFQRKKKKFQQLENDLKQGQQITHLQNYFPIYNQFFVIREDTYHSIHFKTTWCLEKIGTLIPPLFTNCHADSPFVHNVYPCQLRHILLPEVVETRNVFFKYIPLINPLSYILGEIPSLPPLPSPTFTAESQKAEANTEAQPETKQKTPSVFSLQSIYHNAYIDVLFIYLSSRLLNDHSFLHGLDFYATFLGEKENYPVNITNDLEDLLKYPKNIFIQNRDKTYHLPENLPDVFKHLFQNSVKQTIQLGEEIELNLDDILEYPTTAPTDIEKESPGPTPTPTLTPTILEGWEEKSMEEVGVEVMEVEEKELEEEEISEGNMESISSRSSHTSLNYKSDEGEGEEEATATDTTKEDWEEKLVVTLPRIPIQIVCMEHCSYTLDDILYNPHPHPHPHPNFQEDKSKGVPVENKLASALFQTIMTLLTYQKCFQFTHNDLHTNNIMGKPTHLRYLYYKWKGNMYRVPTYGYLYKIIDFGRAIFHFQGKVYGGHHFSANEDASGQYNTEPFYHPNKPRVDPNFSFDLCRLGCCLLDFLDEFSPEHPSSSWSHMEDLIESWCTDDLGKNICYKKSGEERYPDFKLYKMIARNVHNAVPEAQVNHPFFHSFKMEKRKIPKDAFFMNIDELQVYS